MEPIFKVGDKVRIVDLQQLKESDVPFHVVPDMLRLSGVLVVITGVGPDSYSDSEYPFVSSKFPNYTKPDGCRYYLKSEESDVVSLQVKNWQWSSPMLKKVEDSKASKKSNTPLRIKVTRKSIVLNFKN